jgi:Zn ribbon nucleic-acid-binding protein
MNTHDTEITTAAAHCPGCRTLTDEWGRDDRGHRVDCPCAYSDHQIPDEVMDELRTTATGEYVAWGAETLATAAQAGLRLKGGELRDAIRAAGTNSYPNGHQLVRHLNRIGVVRLSLFDHEYRVTEDAEGKGHNDFYRITLVN